MGQEQLIPRLMSADEFYAWLESQSERHELVDGQPHLPSRKSTAFAGPLSHLIPRAE